MKARLLIDGQWVDGGPSLEVHNKYTEQVMGAVATAKAGWGAKASGMRWTI